MTELVGVCDDVACEDSLVVSEVCAWLDEVISREDVCGTDVEVHVRLVIDEYT